MNKSHLFLPDLLLTLPVILLLSLGILVIYSSDPQLAFQQLAFSIIGLFLYGLLSQVEYSSYKHYAKFFYIVSLILLLVVFIVGIETRGSTRWIQLVGIQFQPSEFAKPVLIICLAKFWSTHFTTWKNIGMSFLLILPIFGLIFKQPDLGTAITILAIWLTMLIGSNISFVKLLIMGIASLVVTPISWIFLKNYQKDRILSFLSPTQDPLGVGYNVIQSMIAVGSGEFAGRGLGRGTQSRLRFLPEFRTDFIFASIAEEFGFAGSVIVLILCGLLVGRSLMVINQASDKFGSLLVFGVMGMLFFQVAVNIGMNVGLLPITGITLPLLSYGRSSLLTTLISLSFIASVSRFSRKNKFKDHEN